MEIINLGNKLVNAWAFELGDGYCLVDTGYSWQYKAFKEKLAENKIGLDAIKYVVITHMHADHVGFLKALLSETKPLLIYDAGDKIRLEAGKNNLNTYVSRFEYLIASYITMASFEKTQCFPAVFYDNYADAKTQPLSAYGVEFIFLKGHSERDLCIKIEDKLFCGDVCMNGIGSSKCAPMWIYDKYALLDSWKQILKSGVQTLYPGHGKPIDVAELNKALVFWRTRGVFRLFKNKR